MIDYKDEILSFYYEKRQNFIEAAERHEQNKTHFNYDVMHEAMLELNTVKLLLQRLISVMRKLNIILSINTQKERLRQIEIL